MKAGSVFRMAARAKGVAASFSVQNVDRGLERIRTQLKSIQTDKSYVKIGVLGKAAVAPRPVDIADTAGGKEPSAPLTNVRLALIHEFGYPAGGIPERSFVRASFNRHRVEYLERLRLLVQASVWTGKMPYTRALGILGLRAAADMKNFVTAGPQIQPPNSPRYLLEKIKRGSWRREAPLRAQRLMNEGLRAAGKDPRPLKLRKEGPVMAPRTLVDTGRMIGSITWAVVHRSSGDERRGDNP